MLSGKRNHNDLFLFLHVTIEFMSSKIYTIYSREREQGLLA